MLARYKSFVNRTTGQRGSVNIKIERQFWQVERYNPVLADGRMSSPANSRTLSYTYQAAYYCKLSRSSYGTRLWEQELTQTGSIRGLPLFGGWWELAGYQPRPGKASSLTVPRHLQHNSLLPFSVTRFWFVTQAEPFKLVRRYLCRQLVIPVSLRAGAG